MGSNPTPAVRNVSPETKRQRGAEQVSRQKGAVMTELQGSLK